jgi:hypothetical protein
MGKFKGFLSDREYHALSRWVPQEFDPERLRVRPGRPSISFAPGTHSPRMATRVSAKVKQLFIERAAAEGRTPGEVMRRLIEEYAGAQSSDPAQPPLEIRAVEVRDAYWLVLTLSDGTMVERNVSRLIWDPAFESLATDYEKFRRARVERGTVVWPGNPELAPEILIWGLDATQRDAPPPPRLVLAPPPRKPRRRQAPRIPE